MSLTSEETPAIEYHHSRSNPNKQLTFHHSTPHRLRKGQNGASATQRPTVFMGPPRVRLPLLLPVLPLRLPRPNRPYDCRPRRTRPVLQGLPNALRTSMETADARKGRLPTQPKPTHLGRPQRAVVPLLPPPDGGPCLAPSRHAPGKEKAADGP
jgi:hypothetical protein